VSRYVRSDLPTGGRAKIDQIVDLAYSKDYESGRQFILRDDSLLMVRGWAMDTLDDVPVLAVSGSLNGQHLIRAIYGFPRPDVEHSYGSRAARNCEFRLYLAASGLRSGINQLDILVVDARQMANKRACEVAIDVAKVTGVAEWNG
jgi:hypothetical protein